MARIFRLLLNVIFASTIFVTGALDPAHAQSQTQPTNATYDQLKHELEALRGAVAAQASQIAEQKGMIEAFSKKSDSGTPFIAAIVAAMAAVAAALCGGGFAIWNSNNQAAQARLLKAIEIIMDSRSGYQAAIRRNNLAVFLDDTTKAHLQNIEVNFSGPEHTDLHAALAEAMADKATAPEEVLNIWKTVLKGKKMFDNIKYSKSDVDRDGDG